MRCAPYCHHACSTRLERQKRTNAVHRSVASAKGLWRTNVRYATKRTSLFRHVVARLGGKTVLLTDTDGTCSDPAMVSDGRLALNGRVSGQQTGEDGAAVYKAWTNERIRRHWKLLCVKTRARVRGRPLTHCQILAAMFGDVLFRLTMADNRSIKNWWLEWTTSSKSWANDG